MKVLLIRFSSIGDIVLTTPVARCLKLQLGAEVHYLTKKSFSNILLPNPHIDRVWSFDKTSKEVMAELKSQQFDAVIDLHHNFRSLQVKLALGRPSSSFNKLNWQKWLLVNTGINQLPKQHIVDRYLDAASHLGIQNDGAGLDHFIPADQVVAPEQLHADLASGSFIALVIGATHFTKRLPREKILEICLAAEKPVVILGGKAEAVDGEFLQANAPRVINLCGRLSLHQSASMVRQAEKVITHDTGLMHIAAAFNKEIISIWGNTVPEFGMYPYYPKDVNLNTSMEVAGLSCRPCSKIGHQACPKRHFRCMNDQDISRIIALMNA